MGKRRLQRKHADGDGDNSSVSLSSTTRSDRMSVSANEEVQLDKDSLLDQALDDLREKRGSTREKPEKSICFVCQTPENLWMCVICGFVGCGRYKGGHDIVHWKDTQHCYSLELETQRVWDYASDNYVDRLIQSKTDGKLVELNSHCIHSRDGCGSCNYTDSGLNEALLNSKVEVIVKEYKDLLATQLESQKLYYETLLREVEEETEGEISEAVEMALATNSKVQQKQGKLDECVREKKFLDELNENLMANQEIWKEKLLEAEESERNASRARDDKIQQLKEELKHLMACLEEGNSN